MSGDKDPSGELGEKTGKFDSTKIVELQRPFLIETPALAIRIAGGFLEEAREKSGGLFAFRIEDLRTATLVIQKIRDLETAAPKLETVDKKAKTLLRVLMEIHAENKNAKDEKQKKLVADLVSIIPDVEIDVQAINVIVVETLPKIAEKVKGLNLLLDGITMRRKYAGEIDALIMAAPPVADPDAPPETKRGGFLNAPVVGTRGGALTAGSGSKPGGEPTAVVGFETPGKRAKQINDLMMSDSELIEPLIFFESNGFGIGELLTRAYMTATPLNDQDLKVEILGFLKVFCGVLYIAIKDKEYVPKFLDKLVRQTIALARSKGLIENEFKPKIERLAMRLAPSSHRSRIFVSLVDSNRIMFQI